MMKKERQLFVAKTASEILLFIKLLKPAVFYQHGIYFYVDLIVFFRCNEKKIFMQIRNNCGNSCGDSGGNTMIWHKGCCHGDKSFTEDYYSPMMRTIHQSYEEMNKKKRAKLGLETKAFIAKQCERAWRDEKQYGKSNVIFSCCLADSNLILCHITSMSNSVKRMRNMI